VRINSGTVKKLIALSSGAFYSVERRSGECCRIRLARSFLQELVPGKIADMEASYFEQSWRVVCASLRGRPGYGAFNSAKAGLRTFAQAMAKEYASDGIHVAHVIVDGAIAGDKIFRRFPDAAGREDSLISIEAIVDAFVFLHRQPPRGWSFEIDVRTSREKW
jgi:NAD(P)-dependent dehydrogenase (short-subunit alcohol dehydrogenase family)